MQEIRRLFPPNHIVGQRDGRYGAVEHQCVSEVPTLVIVDIRALGGYRQTYSAVMAHAEVGVT